MVRVSRSARSAATPRRPLDHSSTVSLIGWTLMGVNFAASPRGCEGRPTFCRLCGRCPDPRGATPAWPTSLNRSAPATGAASTSSTVTGSPRRWVANGRRRPARLVETEIFIADVARRNEAVGAGLVELDEQAGARDAGNVAVKVAPTWSARKCAISRSAVSRSAFMARRSVAEMPAAISASARTSVSSGRPSAPSFTHGSAPDARRDRHSAGSAR